MAFVRGIPRGGERAGTLLLQYTLHALDRISFPIEEMFDRAKNLDIAGTVIAPASSTLERLDLRKTRLPESQHMLRQIKLPGDLADRSKRIGAFVHPPLAPYLKLQAGRLDRSPLARARAGAILARINFLARIRKNVQSSSSLLTASPLFRALSKFYGLN